MDYFSVAGKIAVVTGAATGIGFAISKAFWKAGMVVFPVTRREAVDWGDFPGGDDGRWRPLRADLSDREAVFRLVEEAWSASGDRVDVLVNNAAVCPAAKGDPYDVDLMRETHVVDFEAPYILCSRFAALMASRGGGSIINMTSMNAERAWPGNPSYITGKAAVRLLTKSIALDFGSKGVRANNLCPGYIHTRMTNVSASDPAMFEERRSHTMLGRWGEPDDLIGPALFLASDASRYVTGEDLHVDGGWLAKGM